MLSENDIERYSRQLILSFWSGAGQEHLRESVVYIDRRLIAAAVYLAAAGAGSLVLFGPVEPEDDLLAAHLQEINPDVQLFLTAEPDCGSAHLDTAGLIVSAGSTLPDRLRGGVGGITVRAAIAWQAGLNTSAGSGKAAGLELAIEGPAGSGSTQRVLAMPQGIDPHLYAGTSAASAYLGRNFSRL